MIFYGIILIFVIFFSVVRQSDTLIAACCTLPITTSCVRLQGDQVYKSVFIIFFQGEQLKTRVKKICEGFRAALYPCPETPADRREMRLGVMTRIEDLNTVSWGRG